MNEHFNRNDETLVELTLLGDGTAYEELVTRHQRAVMGTAYKVTKTNFPQRTHLRTRLFPHG